jgi:hypothetical protein
MSNGVVHVWYPGADTTEPDAHFCDEPEQDFRLSLTHDPDTYVETIYHRNVESAGGEWWCLDCGDTTVRDGAAS